MPFNIRPAVDADRPFLRAFMRQLWGDEVMVDRERVFYPAEQAAFLAEEGRLTLGVVTYDIRGGQCEVTALNSLRRRQGVGRALMAAVQAEARIAGCRRVWLLTTNDNLAGLAFYQRLGYRLVALYPGAVDQARRLKPAIPVLGESGIAIHDELELELTL
jgi:N-acetylglutamate synthase-like GNAT family acetyltransferase